MTVDKLFERVWVAPTMAGTLGGESGGGGAGCNFCVYVSPEGNENWPAERGVLD